MENLTADTKHLTLEQLEAGLESIRQSPQDEGVLELIVRRPQVLQREMPSKGVLDQAEGLQGDNWNARGSASTPDRSSNPAMQITIMNSRAIALIAQEKDRWQLAGDQLFIDINLSDKNLPAGTRLALDSAILEVTAIPHTGCKKFAERFGTDATKFVNSPAGKVLHVRGVNAKIIRGGSIQVGDIARKL